MRGTSTCTLERADVLVLLKNGWNVHWLTPCDAATNSWTVRTWIELSSYPRHSKKLLRRFNKVNSDSKQQKRAWMTWRDCLAFPVRSRQSRLSKKKSSRAELL